ncbi:MAG TPA: rhomboid family intramembrane serine protease [Propionicimonas sp.]|nr:rhomboid family intramembrane serine protease [Propionicimonas sp.]HRA74704.1 rhomboid family intramembrane serine protease [Propionicimonas sp.]
MSSLFAHQGEPAAPWFRLGRLEVTTTMLVVLAVVASWLAWVVVPSLPSVLYYWTDALLAGDIWRLITWPFANSISLWDVLSLFFFWYFGTDLERQLGRQRMLWLLVGIWASLTLSATLIGFALGGQMLAGISLVQFVILLLWIAEYPNRPFFFGIPAWVVGAVLLGIQALGMIAGRNAGGLLSLILSLALVAITARRIGLLNDYSWIPGRPSQRTATVRATRSRRAPSRTQARDDRRQQTDRERLDDLLDQINESGIHSLTDAQRKEMKRLSERLRGR